MEQYTVCKHHSWLKFKESNGSFFVQDELQLTNIVNKLPRPKSQYPSLALFLGKQNMHAALKELFPRNKFPFQRNRSFTNLRVDATTFNHEYPILVADGDLKSSPVATFDHYPCHPSETMPIAWKSTSDACCPTMLHARLTTLFADTICIFADDYGGLAEVSSILKAFVTLGSASSLSPSIRPRIIVAVSGLEASSTMEILETDDLRRVLKDDLSSSLTSPFFSIKVLKLASRSVSSLARHRRLREVLLDEIDSARDKRLQHRALFSACHMDYLWKHSLNHFCQSATEAFDFIQASRSSNPVSDSIQLHVWTFFDSAWKTGCSNVAMARFIATALIMDAYPPDMHGRLPKNP
jgi:hypothetical protein